MTEPIDMGFMSLPLDLQKEIEIEATRHREQEVDAVLDETDVPEDEAEAQVRTYVQRNGE